MNNLVWQSVMWRPGKGRFVIARTTPTISGRPRPPTNAPLAGPRRSPDSQPQSGYALLPSRIRRHFLIQIDARLSPCLPRSNLVLFQQSRQLTVGDRLAVLPFRPWFGFVLVKRSQDLPCEKYAGRLGAE